MQAGGDEGARFVEQCAFGGCKKAEGMETRRWRERDAEDTRGDGRRVSEMERNKEKNGGNERRGKGETRRTKETERRKLGDVGRRDARFQHE